MQSKEDVQAGIRTDIVEMILSAIKDHLKKIEGGSSIEISSETRLSGKGGFLDSLALVQLLIDIEERLSDRYGGTVALMDEQAMSEKHSPFITVSSLADFIVALVEKQRP